MGTIHLYKPYITPKLTRSDTLSTFEIHKLGEMESQGAYGNYPLCACVLI